MKRSRRPWPPVSMPTGFVGFRFPPEDILWAVRWYLRYWLSYRDLEELLAERGIEVDHVTLYGARRLANACGLCWRSGTTGLGGWYRRRLDVRVNHQIRLCHRSRPTLLTDASLPSASVFMPLPTSGSAEGSGASR